MKVLKTDPKLKVRREGDSWTVVAPAGKALTINHTGWLILRMADGEHTVADIVDALHRGAPGKDRAEVADDVGAFVKRMIKTGCLELISPEYARPTVEVIVPGGVRDVEDVDEEAFDPHARGRVYSSDPPCQR